MKAETLTVDEALAKLALIDVTLDAFETTAPKALAAFGGRDALLNASEMTCLGPMPRLDVATWEQMSREYESRRYDEAGRHVQLCQ